MFTKSLQVSTFQSSGRIAEDKNTKECWVVVPPCAPEVCGVVCARHDSVQVGIFSYFAHVALRC